VLFFALLFFPSTLSALSAAIVWTSDLPSKRPRLAFFYSFLRLCFFSLPCFFHFTPVNSSCAPRAIALDTPTPLQIYVFTSHVRLLLPSSPFFFALFPGSVRVMYRTTPAPPFVRARLGRSAYLYPYSALELIPRCIYPFGPFAPMSPTRPCSLFFFATISTIPFQLILLEWRCLFRPCPLSAFDRNESRIFSLIRLNSSVSPPWLHPPQRFDMFPHSPHEQ